MPTKAAGTARQVLCQSGAACSSQAHGLTPQKAAAHTDQEELCISQGGVGVRARMPVCAQVHMCMRVHVCSHVCAYERGGACAFFGRLRAK